jgi:hypothetical protein
MAPVATSNTRTVFSSLLPVASRVPSGENASKLMLPLSSAVKTAPVAASHIRAVLSLLPVASRVPSGENARQWMEYL